jgi:hypothetical protein
MDALGPPSADLPGSGAEVDDTDIAALFAYDWCGRSPLVPNEAELAAAMAAEAES